MTLKIGDRVAFAGYRLTNGARHPYFGIEGTVSARYPGMTMDLAVCVVWDRPGPPANGVMVDGYLVAIDLVPDETESFFV